MRNGESVAGATRVNEAALSGRQRDSLWDRSRRNGHSHIVSR
ncbi:hypothetical protein RSSM_04948 [Rhodopirellula sallentina SM41]|uniref:Uncharacterized protein n=1 Tax=Rhodopirellula sallentina SM41 TaxID=1263870 RepID=M5UC83_9BACT|nr:hypothetical protein RSSM_04948 [Rhodopirellula sallentina SM41]